LLHVLLLLVVMSKRRESRFGWIQSLCSATGSAGWRAQRMKGNSVVLMIGRIVGSNTVSTPSLVVHRKAGSKPTSAALIQHRGDEQRWLGVDVDDGGPDGAIMVETPGPDVGSAGFKIPDRSSHCSLLPLVGGLPDVGSLVVSHSGSIVPSLVDLLASSSPRRLARRIACRIA
jgi:hypothetical protein